ncbi:unnamed protein product [Heterotrigona itama]|uniref:PiggyBac transposable element-derived protein domain-containing protein n=1 Tax=Heterotrigona itama TaxID=395501 RepID=A0A6V7H1T6_9HYME|nr:unnamed protein product [Heterotrigona itama]
MFCNKTIGYKTDDSTLTIYKSKSKKRVLVLSLMHESIIIEKNDLHIPETIRFCNSTNFGINMPDQMARKYNNFYKETIEERISRQGFLFQLVDEFAFEFEELQEVNQKEI